VAKREYATETSKVVALRAVQGARVVELCASGLTIAQAGQAMGITSKVAEGLFTNECSAIMAENHDQRELLLARELETLRLLKKAWMAKALQGDAVAARIILQISDRTAGLLGLNAAIKVEVSNKRIDTTVAEVLELLENGSDLPMILDAEVG
jgi:hypothetical protein